MSGCPAPLTAKGGTVKQVKQQRDVSATGARGSGLAAKSAARRVGQVSAPTTALAGLRRLMSEESGWWSLSELAHALWAHYEIRASETAVSARLRDLRLEGWLVERQPVPRRDGSKSRACRYRLRPGKAPHAHAVEAALEDTNAT